MELTKIKTTNIKENESDGNKETNASYLNKETRGTQGIIEVAELQGSQTKEKRKHGPKRKIRALY